jgi:AraC-like DNA-binding protein
MPSRRPSDELVPFVRAIDELARPRDDADYLVCPSSASVKPLQLPAPIPTTVAGCPELNLVLRGKIVVVTPVESFPLTPGRILLIETGVEHGEIYPRSGFEVAYFSLHKTNVRVFSDLPGRHPTLDLIGRSDLSYLSDALSSEFGDTDTYRRRSLQSLLTHLACLLHRRLRRESYVLLAARPDQLLDSDERGWGAVEQALGYCAAHFRETITSEDVANATGYSRTHLDRLFSRCLGKTVRQHVRDLRMIHAMDLLAYSRLSVAEIAEAVCYTEPTNLGRAFARAVGVSPRAFRKGKRSGREHSIRALGAMPR